MAKKRRNKGSEVMTASEKRFWNQFFRELHDKLERPANLGDGWVRGKHGVWYEGDGPCTIEDS